MKILFRIQTWTLLAGALLMASCTDDITRGESPVIDPETCNQAVFSLDNVSTLEIAPSATPEVTVTVERTKTAEAILVPVVVVSNPRDVFTGIPQTVNFAAGEAKSSFTVRFDEAEIGKSYKMLINLSGPHADPYSTQNGTILYSLEVIRLKWVSTGEHIGPGTYTHKFLSSPAEKLVMERGEGTNLYRLKNWAGLTNLRFEAEDDAATSFIIPAQPINMDHPDYGPVSVEGTVKFDGEYTYTFNTQYFVSEGTFTSPAEKFVLDHPVDASKFTAQFEVEPAVNEALVGVIPSENTIFYITDMALSANIDAVGDNELTTQLQSYFKQLAEQNNMTLAQVLSIIAKSGEYRYTAEDLDPKSDYTAYAYAVDMQTGKALSPVSRHKFKTLEAGEPSEAYLRYVGTWTVTSSNSVSGGPISYEVTLKQRVPNSSYTMTGWTDIDEYKEDKVVVKYKNSTSKLIFPNLQDFGGLGNNSETGEAITRYYMGYAVYEGDDAPVMPIGGEYDAMEGQIQADGSIKLTGYSGTLTTGGTFTIVGMDFFGRDSQYVHFLPDGGNTNYGLGDYTVVKSTATPTNRIEPMHHRKIRKPGKIGMSFSSATRLMQAR